MSKTEKQKLEENAVITDGQLERGEHPIGHIVHLSTVTHAFRGVLDGVTPSHYLLRKGTVEIVLSVGDLASYGPKTKPSEAETIAHAVRIPRGAVAWEIDFGDP